MNRLTLWLVRSHFVFKRLYISKGQTQGCLSVRPSVCWREVLRWIIQYSCNMCMNEVFWLNIMMILFAQKFQWWSYLLMYTCRCFLVVLNRIMNSCLNHNWRCQWNHSSFFINNKTRLTGGQRLAATSLLFMLLTVGGILNFIRLRGEKSAFFMLHFGLRLIENKILSSHL